MRILIVEDQVHLAEALAEIMRGQKYIVDTVYDGERGLDEALTGIYDVIVLDVMLPRMDGFTVVRQLRREKIHTPVLLLTAKDGTASKVEGLDCGADDYLTKPFVPDELLARVRALGRRQGEVTPDEMVFGDLVLDIAAYTLGCGDKKVRLGPKEFELARLLMGAKGNIVPKEDMLLKVWGAETDAEDNNVEVYISFLRKKLLFLGSAATIATARKLGYHLKE